jgi:hypothetical protein
VPGGVALLELQAQDLSVGGRPVSWPLDDYPLLEQVELPTRVEGFKQQINEDLLSRQQYFLIFYSFRTFK